jgi:hypothetical protein
MARLTEHLIVAAETHGVGELDTTPAEQYEVRERKQSLFQLSSDPFDVLANRHRQSISGDAIGVSAAATRRRSSAVAPDAAAAMAAAGQHHSGYDGNKLETIVSRADAPPTQTHNGEGSNSGHVSEEGTLNRDSIDPVASRHEAVTTAHQVHDPDSVAPHEVR